MRRSFLQMTLSRLAIGSVLVCSSVASSLAARPAQQGIEVKRGGCTILYTPLSTDSASGQVEVSIARDCGRGTESSRRTFEAAGEQRGRAAEMIDPRALYLADGAARDPYFRPYFDRAWKIIVSEQARPKKTFSELPDEAKHAVLSHGLIVTNSISLETDVDELGDAYVLSFPVDGVGRVRLYLSVDSDAYQWQGPFI